MGHPDKREANVRRALRDCALAVVEELSSDTGPVVEYQREQLSRLARAAGPTPADCVLCKGARAGYVWCALVRDYMRVRVTTQRRSARRRARATAVAMLCEAVLCCYRARSYDLVRGGGEQGRRQGGDWSPACATTRRDGGLLRGRGAYNPCSSS